MTPRSLTRARLARHAAACAAAATVALSAVTIPAASAEETSQAATSSAEATSETPDSEAPSATSASDEPNAETAQATIKPQHMGFSDTTPYWRKAIRHHADRAVELIAHSPSMNIDIPLAIIKAGKPDAPTLYLLNGGDGGEAGANWIQQTDVIDFYLDKGINVVIPMKGKFSYYTDWVTDVPQLGGVQRWETFLTKELPGPLEKELQANGKRAIAGMSMSATSALLLAEHNPELYDAVGSFSGCAETSTPAGWLSMALTLNRAKTTPEAMWGPQKGEVNMYNDALHNADKLAGTALYVSNGSGTAGKYDMPNGPRFQDYTPPETVSAMIQTIGVGGVIEATTNVCTHNLDAKLRKLNIPATFNFHNTGTHSWSYWQEDLRESWPVFAKALEL
ncbi:esterase family protein [Corynebacterium uberis]|nr:alpha/beta hydrolase family protein [Corynebacterium uberis]UDL80519.1 esterase family protein [Corynebacterium uberis]